MVILQCLEAGHELVVGGVGDRRSVGTVVGVLGVEDLADELPPAVAQIGLFVGVLQASGVRLGAVRSSAPRPGGLRHRVRNSLVGSSFVRQLGVHMLGGISHASILAHCSGGHAPRRSREQLGRRDSHPVLRRSLLAPCREMRCSPARRAAGTTSAATVHTRVSTTAVVRLTGMVRASDSPV